MDKKEERVGRGNDIPPTVMRAPSTFASTKSRLTLKDLNNNTTSPTFSLYSKDDINTYLSNPYQNEKNLRKAVIYLYGVSPHFRRIIQYFVGLTDLSYYVSPYKIDPKKANVKTTNTNYRKVLDMMSAMNVRSQLPKILTVCLREDVFYGTFWVTNDSVIIQQLPSDYCSISTIEDGVLNVTFDFSYFNSNSSLLPFYPTEFQTKYKTYQNDRRNRWIELDSPNSFAVKCNTDILDYAIPPFSGVLRNIYDLEDYTQMKATKTALENYAMLDMRLPMDSEGNWLLDYDKAKGFWQNLDSVTPEEIGSVLSPMEIKKISFEKSNTKDTDTVAEAEETIFSSAGVSSLLFNNDKASANALLLSIKADQAMTFGIVKSIEDVINRLLHSQSYGKYFKVTFIDSSPFNRKEMGDQYLKAAQYGLPTVMMYAASQGLGQAEFDSMNFLENTVLELKQNLVPLMSSTNTSAETLNGSGEVGAPEKDVGEVSDKREANEESE